MDIAGTHRVRTAWLLLAALLLPLPALLIGQVDSDSTRHMEALTLATSQETWLRQHAGEENAWLLPSRNGHTRVRKPPGCVWLNLLAWTGLTPGESSPDELILRSRLLGIALALTMLAASFWIGCQLKGPTLGLAAALVLGSMHAFLDQARVASYDTHLMAWCAVAIACGMAGLRGGRRSTSYIMLSGLALGMAFLSKGPVALVHTVLPLSAMALSIAHKRGAALKTLLGALLVAATLALPWYIYLIHSQGDALATLFGEYRAERSEAQPPWYYLGLLAMALPWTLWLLAGIFAAIRKHGRRREFVTPLAWLGVVVLLMSIPAAKQQRYIVPVMPAAALTAAAAWLNADFMRRGARILRRAHWTLLMLASLLLPAYMLLQKRLIAEGLIDQPDFPGVPAAAALPGGLLLIALVAAGCILHRRGRAGAALAATAGWMILAFTFAHRYYSQSHHAIYEQKPDCARVLDAVGDDTLYYLEDDIGRKDSPDEKFLLYTRRIVPPVRADGFGSFDGEYVMIIRSDAKRAVMEAAGFEPLFDFDDGRASRALYHRAKRIPGTAEMPSSVSIENYSLRRCSEAYTGFGGGSCPRSSSSRTSTAFASCGSRPAGMSPGIGSTM